MERKEGGSKRKPERIRAKRRERREGGDTFLDLLFHLHFIYFSKNKSTYIPNKFVQTLFQKCWKHRKLTIYHSA